MSDLLKKLFAISFYAFPLFAQDLGVQGHTFEIEEISLLKHLLNKLKMFTPEEIDILEDKLRKHYLNLIEEPASVLGIGEAKEYQVYFYDPTICVAADILDQKGNIIVAKGTRVNPLTISEMKEGLLFFDGTKASHLKWAREQPKNAKWVLIKGRPLELEESENRQVYFDQFGALTSKLQVKNIPAKVTQDGLMLKIEVWPIEDLCLDF